MLNLNKRTYTLLYLMLFSPILSFITIEWIGVRSSTYYFEVITWIYGIILIFLLWSTIKIPKFVYFLAFYIIYLFIWTFFNGEFDSRGLSPIIFKLKYTAILLIILVIYNTKFNARFIKNSILIIKITVIATSIVSIIQIFNKNFFAAKYIIGSNLTNLSLYVYRRVSIFGYVDSNEFGLSYMPLLSVLAGFLLYRQKKSYLFYLILGGLSAFLTNARYIIAAFILILIQLLVYQKAKITKLFQYAIVLIIILFVISRGLVFLGYNFSNWFEERLFREGSIQETTRYKAYENFLIFITDSPVFGTGVHMTQAIEEASRAVGSSQIHVGYLSHLLSYGIVGSFFLFGFWFFLARNLYKTAKNTNYWGSFFAFLIYLWAQVTLVNYSIFFYGIIFALVFDKYYKDKQLIT